MFAALVAAGIAVASIGDPLPMARSWGAAHQSDALPDNVIPLAGSWRVRF